MKDVPALLNGVKDEIVAAYTFIRNDSQSIAPKILADDWFDEGTIFGESVRILRRPSGPGMPGKARRARREKAYPPTIAVAANASPRQSPAAVVEIGAAGGVVAVGRGVRNIVKVDFVARKRADG
jgi:hypothetical protein